MWDILLRATFALLSVEALTRFRALTALQAVSSRPSDARYGERPAPRHLPEREGRGDVPSSSVRRGAEPRWRERRAVAAAKFTRCKFCSSAASECRCVHSREPQVSRRFYSPDMVISATRKDGATIGASKRRSFATASMPGKMPVAKFEAIVTPSTGCVSSPFSMRMPAAPRL